MTVFLVITEDRHADVEVTPFTDEAAAVAFAERQVRDNARHPESIEPEDRELNDRMRADGWLWYCQYSGEGDNVRVIRRELLFTRSTPADYHDLAAVTDSRGKQWKYSEPSDTWCLVTGDVGPGSVSLGSARSWQRLLHEFGPLTKADVS